MKITGIPVGCVYAAFTCSNVDCEDSSIQKKTFTDILLNGHPKCKSCGEEMQLCQFAMIDENCQE